MDYKLNDDQLLILSQFYTAPTITQFDVLPQAPQQGEGKEKPKKTKRRRNGKRGDNDSSTIGYKKRKLSDEQANALELNFSHEHKLESQRKDKLASQLGLDPRQVAIWFQNRRARWKCNKIQEEYSKLKNLHQSILLEKLHLQSQVVKLQEQLCETEKEKERLMKSSIDINGSLSNNSSCTYSSSSMDQQQQFGLEDPFLGDFMLDGFDDVSYMPQYDYGLDWGHFM